MVRRYNRKYKGRGRRRGNAWNYCAGKATSAGASYLAKKALSGINYLKGLVNSERFKHNRNFSTTIPQSGSINHLTNIATGDQDGQRTGNSIFVRSVSGKFYITKSASEAYTLCRFMLIRDNQQVSDTAPSVTDVLESASPTSLLNDTSVGRFTILMSRMIKLDDVNSSAVINFYKNMRNHVRYNGTASTDQQKGALYLLYIADQATNLPSISGDLRVSYHDN